MLATSAYLGYTRHINTARKPLIMKPSETSRVEAFLKKTFSNSTIKVIQPKKAGAPIEVSVGGEFIGVLHRDEDDGEVSYSLHITILEEDLPPVSKGSNL